MMVCRVCLKDSQNVLEIFGTNGEQLGIADILRQHFWFQPTPDDAISNVICRICWIKVNAFHQFYLLVEQAHALHATVDIKQEPATATLGSELIECEVDINEGLLDFIDVKHAGDVDEYCAPKNPLDDVEMNAPLDQHPVSVMNVAEHIKMENSKVQDTVGTFAPRSNLGKRKCSIANEVNNTAEHVAQDALASAKQRKSKAAVAQTRTLVSRRKIVRKRTFDSTENNAEVEEKKAMENEIVRKYIAMGCELCTFVGNDFADIRQHFKAQHVQLRPYVMCCDKKLCQRTKLVQHAYTHENPEHYKCTECQKVFKNCNTLKDHKRYRHAAEDELVYACDQCPKKYPLAAMLRKHKLLHLPNDAKKFACKECPKNFASDQQLQYHITMCHRMETNVCHVCAKAIRNRYSFAKHVRSHFEMSAARVQCTWPNCDQWLKDEENLKKHIKSKHEGAGTKVLHCNQCAKQCNNKKSLRSHMQYAHSNEVHACEQCNKTFKRAVTLREHMTQHTGERLYNCPFCTQTFNSNANMYAHKKRRHPVEWDLWRKTNQPHTKLSIKS